MDTYTAIASALAALAALASGYSGVKSLSSGPTRTSVRLAQIVFDSLRIQRAYFQRAIAASTSESATDPFLAEVHRAMLEISRANEAALNKADDVLSDLTQELDAVRLRGWVQLGAALGLLSAALQLYGAAAAKLGA